MITVTRVVLSILVPATAMTFNMHNVLRSPDLSKSGLGVTGLCPKDHIDLSKCIPAVLAEP